MRRERVVLLVAAPLAFVAAACGGSSSNSRSSSPPTTSAATSTTLHVAKVAAADPSESAKMICADEAKKDLAGVVGIDTIQPLAPTWKDHVYACDYVYPNGNKMTLSVKELSSADETTAYYDSLAQKLGKKDELQGLGQGAFATTNGSIVARKDYKVLLVDVSHLPQQFGNLGARGDIALQVVTTIMGCWTGA